MGYVGLSVHDNMLNVSLMTNSSPLVLTWTSKTLAPLPARAKVIDLPIPLVPPVTRTVCPFQID